MLRGSCRPLALPLALALVACGAELEPRTTELTVAEASELSEVILFATFNSTSVLPAPRPASAGAWGMDFEAEVRCPAGGKVAMAASLTFVEAEGRATYGITQIHDDCAAQPMDHRFSVVGAPRMTAEVSVRHGDDGAEAWEGIARGEVEWKSPVGRGRCALRLDFQGERKPGASAVAQVEGTVCGQVVDHTMNIS